MISSKQQKTNILSTAAAHENINVPQLARERFNEAGQMEKWHTHAGLQILVVTDGCGYYQEEGKSVQVLQSGDVVFILPEVSHWHAAACQSEFTDVLIPGQLRNELVTWLQKTNGN